MGIVTRYAMAALTLYVSAVAGLVLLVAWGLYHAIEKALP